MLDQNKLISEIEKQFKSKIIEVQFPPQGMDSEVFFIKDNHGHEYAIKHSGYAINDLLAYELLKENKLDIPAPKLIGTFRFEKDQVLILEKIQFPLLESVPEDQMHRYVPSMVRNLKKIHQVKSDEPGFLSQTEKKSNWKEFLLSKFSGSDPGLDWEKIVLRKGLDARLILKSLNGLIKTIDNTHFIDRSYSFLHTDFNQRNLFVNPDSSEITGIIDWSEAMFGDPVYDFARVRMFIWHFNLENVQENYYKLLSFTTEQKHLEELYWLSWVIEYLAWYSEELNEFNIKRIKLHQDFLSGFKWRS